MPAKSLITNQCSHINARGRRCRMLVAPDHDSLCPQHLRDAAASQQDDAVLADELLNSAGDLASVGEVNAFLCNVVKLRARKLIDRKDAVAFGYHSQLLLSTLHGMEKLSEEERDAQALEEVNEDIRKMRASFLANYSARHAAKAAKKPQNNPSTGTKDPVRPASKPAPSDTPAPTESAAQKPPRDYFSICT
jgi:cell division septation protein DedD